MKKQSVIISFAIIALLNITGCGNKIDYTLPEKPIEFNSGEFVNPTDERDVYLSIEYDDRIYIPYGSLKSSIDGNDVGECLGYYVQDGDKKEDMRFFTLNNDYNKDFLVRIDIVGHMNQPDFFRAVDTKNKKIKIPDYIDSSNAESFWK